MAYIDTPIRPTYADTSWFTHDRLGCFIHFGSYAMAARHEWVKSRERIPEAKYDLYAKYFNPDLFDAKQWARDIKNAGMKYAVLTTKHHEGFCMWDTRYTDYKITNTEFGRDLVREYADALREEGIKVGFYYSLIDWHHPEYPPGPNHPRAYDPEAPEMCKNRDMKKYAKYMRDQIRELLTNYGEISYLFFDFSYKRYKPADADNRYPYLVYKGAEEWETDELFKVIRECQPNILVNDRTDTEQDVWTQAEQVQPDSWMTHKETGERYIWETCQTFSGAWGYYRDEYTWKTPEMLIQILVNTVSRGGNLLLNVGPNARGEFDSRARHALDELGKWMHVCGRSIYGCTQSPYKAPEGFRYTQNEQGTRLYLHMYSYPFSKITLEGIADKVEYAQFLHDASELLFTKNEDNSITIKLPVLKPDVAVPVIELMLV